MSKKRVIVLSVVHQGLSVRQAAAKYQVSVRWVQKLLKRYLEEGPSSLERSSRRPNNSPTAISEEMRQWVLATRFELVSSGFDAGAHSIFWQIQRAGASPPSLSSIRRILLRAGAITPQPRKRPRTSYIRFQAEQPNETWQSDFTHWRLADGSDVEILNFLDDHSRFLIASKVFQPVTSSAVVSCFLGAVAEYGPPSSTLTDNGLVYTTRFIGGKSPFEYTLDSLGIKQKNGSPGHPQTQGKIERFHQTLKRFLAQMPKAQTLEELQIQLDQFRHRYNKLRPHRSLANRTPFQAYHATIKATPETATKRSQYRVRYDRVGSAGKVTLRRAGILHKLGVGRAHLGKRVLLLIDEQDVLVSCLSTGEILGGVCD